MLFYPGSDIAATHHNLQRKWGNNLFKNSQDFSKSWRLSCSFLSEFLKLLLELSISLLSFILQSLIIYFVLPSCLFRYLVICLFLLIVI